MCQVPKQDGQQLQTSQADHREWSVNGPNNLQDMRNQEITIREGIRGIYIIISRSSIIILMPGSKTAKKKVVRKKKPVKRRPAANKGIDVNAELDLLLGNYGEGIIDDAKRVVKNTIDVIKGGVRKGPSPNLRSMFSKYGDKKITKISIQRAPVQKAIKIVSDVLTSGKFSKTAKQLGYDDIYHLSMILELDNAKSVRYEKNEVAVTVLGDSVIVPIKKPIKLIDFIDKTVKAVGVNNYYLYSADKYNCQEFLMAHLKANGLANSTIEKFIMQDAAVLLQKDPSLIGAFKQVTDIGAIFNVIKEGRGVTDFIRKILRTLGDAFDRTPKTVKYTDADWARLSRNAETQSRAGNDIMGFLSSLNFLK